MIARVNHGLATVIAAVALLVGPAAQAHHSASMFDAATTARLAGDVASVEWTNPHVWLSVRDPRSAQTWHFELPGPGAIARMGFSQDMFTPGAPVTIEHHPLRDGRRGGLLLTVTLADGRVMRAAGAAPGAQR